MRTKLLSALLLASTAVAGVASADPIIRDHRYDRPVVTYRHPSRYWTGRARVNVRPSWMSRVNFGFQVDNDGDEVQPYTYGNDPYVEGIARGEWYPLSSSVMLPYNQNSEINVDLSGQRLQAIELQATAGSNYIREVHVELNDGQELKLSTNRVLDAYSAPNLRLDLGPEASSGVRRIEIFGYGSGGQFNVIGA